MVVFLHGVPTICTHIVFTVKISHAKLHRRKHEKQAGGWAGITRLSPVFFVYVG
jgi:hypothetical protein